MKDLIFEPVSLHGIWRFKLDEDNVGINEEWYKQILTDKIILPGILQAQGYGNKITTDTPFVEGLHDRLWFLRDEYKDFTNEENTKVPFLSQPQKHYTGAAWYQTNIDIPEEWSGKQIELFLERVRWKTSVWVDDIYYGDYDSLCAEHKYIFKAEAGKHVLTIRVDNTMIFPYRPDAHSVSDSVGSTWNGIAGKIELKPVSNVWMDDISIYPDFFTKSADVKIKIKNISGSLHSCLLNIQKVININSMDVNHPSSTEDINFNAVIAENGSTLEYTLHLGEQAACWDEFNPTLHELSITLSSGDDIFDNKTLKFGLRSIKTNGRNFVLNGRNVSFRGTHDAGCFPLTGYPSTDINEWKRILSICKNWGLNHVRFHSWCPPEAAFNAADELGIYLQVECGMWNYFIQGGEIEKQLHIETDRIIKAFGNHPSFILFASGNEPHGNYQPCLKEWVAKYRKIDSRRLYCAQSGWMWPIDTEPLGTTDYFYTCSRREWRMRGIHGWFGKDYSKYIEDIEAPFLSHELGQYCAYPDFSIMEKFTSYLQPENYKIFKHSMEKHKLLHKNVDFAYASGILQAAAYKEEVEANLRTYGYSGFSLLDLHDYLGQGTALIGLLDAFWDEKGYISPDKFRRFCSPVVPLARINKLVYKSDEILNADLEIACYDKNDILDSLIYWKIENEDGTALINGMIKHIDIKTGGNTKIGKIEAHLNGLKSPSAYKLIVGIHNTLYENDWKIWVYPEKLSITEFNSVNIVRDFKEALLLLKEGKKVLFLPKPEDIDFNSPPISITPVFWNSQMGPKWSRSLGLWCDTSHPALSEFPTSCGMEWQWKEIINSARGINIESLPDELEPFIWPIDDWNRNYKLALAFEASVYDGKLIVCSADLESDLENRPAAKQLLYSLLKYMDSSVFNPLVKVTQNQLESFLFNTTLMRELKAQASIVEGYDDANTLRPIDNILDGDPTTYWLAGGKYGGKYPFTIEIEVNEPVSIKGISVMPRQDHRDAEGAVKKYEIYVPCGETWDLIASGDFPASYDLKKIYFKNIILVKKLRFKLIEGFHADKIFYWQRSEKKGFTSAHEPYRDECVSLSEVSFILVDDNEVKNSNDIKINYKNSGTASEEIY